MKCIYKIGLAMTCLCFASGLALGDEENIEIITNRTVTRLGEIVVKAPKEARDPVDTPTVESVSLDIATSSVEARDIRIQSSDTLVEAMEFAPGVFTERRGRKEKSFTSFRGQIYPYPDIAVNGVWQRAFTSIPPFFPAAAIDRIEILRSGGAIMVGPNAGLVGAINIIPRRFDELTTLLDIEAGSYGTYRASLVHGNRLENSDYTVGAKYYSTEGPDNENAAEQISSVFGTTSWDVGDNLHMEFTGYGLTGNRELRKIQDPGRKRIKNRENEEFSPLTSYGGILRALWKHDKTSSTAFDAGYVRRDMDYQRANPDPSKPDIQSDEVDWEYNAGVLHAQRIADNNTLRTGVQYNHWVAPEGKRYYVGNRMDVETVSGIVVDEHQWDRLTLDGGFRVTRSYYHDYTDNNIDMLGGPVADDRSGGGTSLFSAPITDEWGDPVMTSTIGAKYRLSKITALYAHAAFGSVDAPPGAVPEKGKSLSRESRTIFDGGVSFSDTTLGSLKVGGFATFREDGILLTSTEVTRQGDTFNAYENRDLRQYGLEMEYESARIMDIFTLFVNGAVMDSEQSDSGDWSNLREIPDVITAAGLYSQVGRVDVNIFGKYVSGYENKRFAEDRKYKDLGDFVDLNMTAGVLLGKERATRLYASLENILDDEYSTVVGFPDYGFQAFAGVQHQF